MARESPALQPIPSAAASSPATRPASDLFVGQSDGLVTCAGAEFFGTTNDAAMQPATTTLRPSSPEPPTRVDQLPGQGELPKPCLVHGKSQSGNEGEPFNLQARVFPNNPSREVPSSARLLAAEEGRPLTTKGEIDGPQETGLHSAPGMHLNTVGGVHQSYEGAHLAHPYQGLHPLPRQESYIHPSQQHAFIDRLAGPGVPQWQIPGAPYAYHRGWYNHPAAPYPPPYLPSNHPPYHGPYAEGTSHVPSTMLQPQNNHAGHPNYSVQHAAVTRRPNYYYSGIVAGGYEEPHGDPPLLGQTGTLPNVTVANTAPQSLPPSSRPGDASMEVSPSE